MNHNQSTIVGRVARDPKFFEGKESEHDRLLFTLMVNRMGGEQCDAVPVILWSKAARNGAKYISKGKELLVSGPLVTYFDKETETNHFQIRGDIVQYGADSKKQQVATSKEKGDDEIEQLAAKLAGKKKTNSKREVLLNLLIDKHGLSEERAQKLADGYFRKEKEEKEKETPPSSSTPSYDDIPF